jgi:hypothetical protein
MIDLDTKTYMALHEDIKSVVETLPTETLRNVLKKAFDAAESDTFTVRVLGRANSGKTTLMDTLVHGPRLERRLRFSWKFDTIIMHDRGQDGFKREVTCLSEVEKQERLAKLNAMKARLDEPGGPLESSLQREFDALQEDRPEPDALLGTLGDVKEDLDQLRKLHWKPG